MRVRPSFVPFVAGLMALLVLSACSPTPPNLTPQANAAFQSTRIVKALDVVRDAAIAGNEMVPPKVSTNSTRTVVLWHKTAVTTIQAVPNGWKATVRAGIWALTCDTRAYDPPTGPYPACTPQIAADEVTRLAPYIGLALIVIAEVTL